MIRVAIKSLGASALLVLAVGCQNPAEKQVNERADARKEIPEAGKDAQKKIEEAREDLDKAEQKFGEKVGDANQEITDEVKEASKQIGDADKAANEKMIDARYARFEILKNESESAFATRAEEAMDRLQPDVDNALLDARTPGASQKVKDAADKAKASLDEARKDLTELRSKTGKLFDDGRLGVGLAINKTQRELDTVHEEMAAAKM